MGDFHYYGNSNFQVLRSESKTFAGLAIAADKKTNNTVPHHSQNSIFALLLFSKLQIISFCTLYFFLEHLALLFNIHVCHFDIPSL